MNSTERMDFDSSLAQLFGGYDKPLTDAKREGYWSGLQKMPLVAFQRVVEHALGPDGPAQVPNTKDIWGLYRKLRSRAAPLKAEEPAPNVDTHVAEGNLALVKYLVEHEAEAAAPHALPALVAEKNRVAGQYRELEAAGEEVPPKEKQEVYFRAFDRVFRPATFEHVEAFREQFARERNLEFRPARPRREAA